MLNNKITMVTGASMGIGLATVNKFLKEGATVIGVGPVGCNPSSKIDKRLSDKFSYFECDVTDENEIKEVCAKVNERFERLDSLVTVCDKYYEGNILTVNSDIMSVASKHIVQAPILFTKYCNDMLHKSSNPSITHDVPVSALMIEGDFLMSILNTSIVNYVRQAASAIRPVRINAAMYGLIDGHLLTEDKKKKYTDPKNSSLLPAGRLGKPEDVASFNAFLASDKCRYINSAAMQVDGGLYTMNPRSMGSAI